MEAMNKIRALTRMEFKGLRQIDIARLIGVSPSTAQRFMSGKPGSVVIAKYMADNYGGEYVDLLLQHRIDIGEDLSARMAYARNNKSNLFRFPGPGNFVEMAERADETHNMIDLSILPDNLQTMAGYIHE